MRRTLIKTAAALALAAVAAVAMAQAPGGGPPGGPGAGPPRAGGGAPRGGGGFGLVPMLVESKAFQDGGIIPDKYSMYGGSTLPDFTITGAPATAQTIAIIFHDLDVASGGNPDDNLHWMAWNIPVVNGTATIPEGQLPQGAMGRGMRGSANFAGPGAPYSVRYHHYVFEFYALSSTINLPDTGSRPELLEAMKGKVVGKAAYVGRFRAAEGQAFPRGGGGGPPRGGPGAPPPGAAPGGA